MFNKSSTAAVFAVLVLTVCGTGLAAAQAPADGGAVPAKPPAAGGPPPPAQEPPNDYRVGAGDSLQIFVWDHADLTTTVQVRPDGRISTPLVEDLQAAGKTPTVLARDVEKVLSEYVRSPVVTVIVQAFVGETERQIRVVGQAAAPKALQYRVGMTVLDVVIQVGGLSPSAAGNRAQIVRKVDGKKKEIKVKLDDLLNKGRLDQNIEMLPGDVLVIPQSVF